MARIFTPHQRRERGSVLIITLLVMVALLGLFALSIDLGYVLSGRAQLQNGIDSAALAATAGLRTAIVSNASPDEQKKIIIQLAQKFASLNEVRRYGPVVTTDPNYPSGLMPDPRNYLQLDPTEIDIYSDTPQRVRIRHSLPGGMPTFFANLFGFSSIQMSAGAYGAVVPVDGGSGMISGCWRPLMVPDTYFDQTDLTQAPCTGIYRAWIFGDPNHSHTNRAYYRSRFATEGGDRNVNDPSLHFGNSIGSPCPQVTSLRDAKSESDLQNYGVPTNLMGRPIAGQYGVFFSLPYYRLADFEATYPASIIPWATLTDLIRKGFCGTIRVGGYVKVFDPGDTANLGKYQEALFALYQFYYEKVSADPPGSLSDEFSYIKSGLYPTPNTHPIIIPVLMFDPFQLVFDAGNPEFRVTNIGALRITAVDYSNKIIYGMFVREVVTGGTSLDPNHNVIQPDLLPASVRLIR